MCIECSTWKTQAIGLWNQVFAEHAKFQALIPSLPPPIAASANNVLQGINFTPLGVNYVIDQFSTVCPQQLSPENRNALLTARAQMISIGQSWLKLLTDTVTNMQTFLNNAAVMNMQTAMQTQWLDAMRRTNESWERTFQNIQASNRALAERQIKMLSGQPFIEVLWGNPPY
jgi:hypothetical protein